MRTAYGWIIVFFLCAVPVSAEEPRKLERERRIPGTFHLPVVVDGVRFQPEEMEQFAGQRLYYVLDRSAQQVGMLYAFTSPESQRHYIEDLASERTPQGHGELEATINAICPDARFNKVPGGTGVSWLPVGCGQKISTLNSVPGDWNNRISYVEASGSWTVVNTCHYFDTANGCDEWAIEGGVTIYDLTPYGFNNRISSIKVCPQGITFTECSDF